jgi:hypothetical protein
MITVQPVGAVSRVGSASSVLLGLFAACIAFPPEIYGLGFAAAAILAALAAAVTSQRSAAAVASRWVWAAVPASVVAIRVALSPGEAVVPIIGGLVAALAGIAALGVTVSFDKLGLWMAAAVGLVSVRALYETIWGLAGRAAMLRASAGPDAGAMLNRLEQGRPYAGFVTPAALGCFFAMTLPVVVAWALSRRGLPRVLGWLAAISGTAGLLATRSVTAMAALGGALAIAALRRRVPARTLVGAGLILAAGAVTAAIVRPDAVFAPSNENSPWRLRAGNVRIALEIARDHPLGGVGPGGYAAAFPLYRRPADNETRHAHALPAELVAEWGIPGGSVLALAFFWLFIGPLLRARRDAPPAISAVTIGLAAFALHNLVDFTALLPSLLVVAAIARGLIGDEGLQETASAPARFAWIALATACAAVASGAGLGREALYDARQAALAGEHAGALAAAARAERLAPWDPDAPQFGADAQFAAGAANPAVALAEADRAVFLAPARASARQTRARARAMVGDSPGAFADLVEAARLYPMNAGYAGQRDALGAALRKASSEAPR